MFLRLTARWATLKYMVLVLSLLATTTGTDVWDATVLEEQHGAGSAGGAAATGASFPHFVLDRVVDGTYAVFLVGPDEYELILPLTLCVPGGGAALCAFLSRAGDEAARSRIEEKLPLLQNRAPSNRPMTED